MSQRVNAFIVFFALLAFSCLAASPLYPLTGWYRSHTDLSYQYYIQEFKAQFENGMWYPRWAPRFFFGYGYTTFLFYQPGFFFFLLPFTYLPITLLHVFMVAITAIFLIGTTGSYKLARQFNIDRYLCVLLAACYVFMPYAYINAYVRSDLSEFFAMMLCPWVMYGIFRIRDESQNAISAGAFCAYISALAAVLLSHPHVALFLVFIIAWFVLVELAATRFTSRCAYALMSGGVMASILTAPYWLTFIQLAPYITYNRISRNISQFIPPTGLFSGASEEYARSAVQNMGVMNGFYILLSCMGYMLIFRTRLFWQLFPLWFLPIFMISPASEPLWLAMPYAGYIQFTWRVVSVAGLLQCMGMMLLVRSCNRFPRPGTYFIFGIIVVAATMIQPVTLYPGQWPPKSWRILWARPLDEDRRAAAELSFSSVRHTFASAGEFDPIGLSRLSFTQCVVRVGDKVEAKPDSGIIISNDAAAAPYRVLAEFDIPSGAIPSAPDSVYELPYIIINQLYFPGWSILINDEPVLAGGEAWREQAVMQRERFGRMQIFFPKPGHYRLNAHYEGPPYWLARNIMMVLLLSIASVLCVRFKLVRLPAFCRFRNSRAMRSQATPS